MACLCRLPTELLHQIANYLDDNSTASLELSCRLLSYAISSRRTEHYENLLMSRSFRPFLKRLCKVPELAQYVRSVRIRGPRSRDPYPNPKFRGQQTAVVALVIATAEELGVLKEENASEKLPHQGRKRKRVSALNTYWVQDLRNGSERAQIIFILSLLPNLERLVIDELPCQVPYEPSRLLEHSASAKTLKHLEINAAKDAFDATGSVVDRDLHTIGSQHALQSIRLSNVSFRQQPFMFLPRFQSSSISTVIFSNCAISIDFIRLIGNSATKLETFHYRFGHLGHSFKLGNPFFRACFLLPDVLTALLPCAQSLKCLELIFPEDEYDVQNIPPMDKSHTQTILDKFTMLETVQIPLHLCDQD
ncbi:uncharacterized protein BDR25DRAFT_393390 [Lindgomyces ingoldianus]|uniref:Uncharacterized protein n=1 Tax=Lindgomyces ingoldianus TaxID=673940 RepID=A0ACB6QW00_9PLEO|nr:uncharacterized protein BDR25DRAFT_393390 [Lindgomyces ingoldianus]KAF2471179.1 hypothetical protein BDR25DRAFT_393390 [Lindgomyces ingoldianus]